MQYIRFRGRCLVGLSSLVALIAVTGYGLAAEITFPADKLMSHVRFLASEELRGRKAGSSDERRAAEYIADQLDAAGVVSPPGYGRYQDFRVSAERAESERHSTNVLGWIEGAEPILRDQIIVVGAHLDHLGVRRGETYPGADDNASGVAAILEIAAALQTRRELLGRSVLVAYFGSEEIGLVGSKRFVSECPIPLDRIVAMVNVDMIGRELLDRASFKTLKRLIRIDGANSVGVLGAGTRPLFAQVVDSACQQVGLTAYGTQNVPFLSTLIDNLAKNRSDHAPFENVGIPTVFFSSGESDDYHRPSDTIDTIDAPLMARRTEAIYATVVALSNAASNELPPIQNARPPAGQRVETLTLTHGRLGVDFQDNSDSPSTLSGLQSLFYTQNTPRFDAFDPDAPGASAGLNFEHIIYMFDRTCTPEDEMRFSVFKFKLPEKPRPAWDFQYVIRRVQKDREYGFRGRLMWKKWVGAEDCLDQYHRWTRELARSQ